MGKNRNTQKETINSTQRSSPISNGRRQHLRSRILLIPFINHFISTASNSNTIIPHSSFYNPSTFFQDLIHAIFKLVWTRKALGFRSPSFYSFFTTSNFHFSNIFDFFFNFFCVHLQNENETTPLMLWNARWTISFLHFLAFYFLNFAIAVEDWNYIVHSSLNFQFRLRILF